MDKKKIQEILGFQAGSSGGAIFDSYSVMINNSRDSENALVKDSILSEISEKDVKAVYPEIRVCHSDKLNLNYRYYPASELEGSYDPSYPEDTTGHQSFIYPYNCPVITEHRSGDSWFGTSADEPCGRIISSSFIKRPKSERIPCKDSLYPGFANGSGHISVVAAITGDAEIEKVLGGRYHTVSIGARSAQVFESISGLDLVDLYKKEMWDEFPPYETGKTYTVDKKEHLSYLIYSGIQFKELSYVNTPADTSAYTLSGDIGREEVDSRLLVAEKITGSKDSYGFFDIATKEKVKEVCGLIGITDSIKSTKQSFVILQDRNMAKQKPEDILNTTPEDNAPEGTETGAEDTAHVDFPYKSLVLLDGTRVVGLSKLLESSLSDAEREAVHLLLEEGTLTVDTLLSLTETMGEHLEALDKKLALVSITTDSFLQIADMTIKLDEEGLAKVESLKPLLSEDQIKTLDSTVSSLIQARDTKDKSTLSIEDLENSKTLSLSVFDLVDNFVNLDPKDTRTLLASLYSVVKSVNLDVSDFEEDAKRYSILSSSTLSKLIRNHKKVESEDSTQTVTSPTSVSSVEDSDTGGTSANHELSQEDAFKVLGF